MTLAGSLALWRERASRWDRRDGRDGLDWRYRRRSRALALADLQAELAVVGEDQVLGEGGVRGFR